VKEIEQKPLLPGEVAERKFQTKKSDENRVKEIEQKPLLPGEVAA
jgi:hypothetical protein